MPQIKSFHERSFSTLKGVNKYLRSFTYMLSFTYLQSRYGQTCHKYFSLTKETLQKVFMDVLVEQNK